MSPFGAALSLVGALLVVPQAVTPQASASPAATCDGRPATIEAHDREGVSGTAGDDVIVTTDVRRVYSGDGDDVVCYRLVDRSFRPRDPAFVFTASGNDRIFVSGGAGDRVLVEPSYGDDVVVGGPEDDDVDFQGDQDGAAGADRYDLGAGADRVAVVPTSFGTNDLTASLGRGDDTIDLYAGLADEADIDGGPGNNTVVLDTHGCDGEWQVDNVAGDLSCDGQRRLGTWSQFDSFRTDLHPHATVSFRGGPRSETVEAPHHLGTVRLGGGDDALLVQKTQALIGARLQGGPGRDLLLGDLRLQHRPQELRVDLARGRISWLTRVGHPLRTARFSGLERLAAGFEGDVTATGSRGDDELAVDTCDGSVHLTGGGGDDVLTLRDARLSDFVRTHQIRECDSVARGRLDGGPGADVLRGGPGRDRADGGPGRDRCTQVDVAIRC
ncbi:MULTISPECIES: hypothetical protein [unclassified Nocardioides]|uniref:hypothetical protein n=1 Tax=unclassified Nocardioides TaxID=2615069 RepID=UPI001055E8DD|nr:MULTISPECIES: hypothetical protein [unclassified Nocardioides]